MPTLGDLTNENLDQLESQIRGYSGDIGLSKNQRQALLGVASSRLGMTTDADARQGIIDRTRQAITGLGGATINKDQTQQLGALGQLAVQQYPWQRTEKAFNIGLASGGAVPGGEHKMHSTGDDTMMPVESGEYMLPVEVVHALGGKQALDSLVSGIKAKMGKNPVEHMMPHMGKATGGYIDDAETQRQKLFGNRGSLADVYVYGNPTVDTSVPNFDPHAALNFSSTDPLQNAVATIDNGDTTKGVMKTGNGYALQSLTPGQGQSLQTAWDARNTGDNTDVNKIPVQYGGRVGTYGDNLALKKQAIQDIQDAQNTNFGMNVNTGMPIDQTPQGLAAVGQFRASLNRADANEAMNQLRQQAAMEMMSDKLKSATDLANQKWEMLDKFNQRNNDRAWQTALLRLAKGGSGGNGSNPAGEDVDALAQAIASGHLDPNQISKRGGLQSKVFAKVTQLVPEFNFNQATGNAQWAKNVNINKSVAILDSINPLLDELKKAHTDLGFTKYPAINKTKRMYMEQTGDGRITAYDNLRNNIILEVTNAMQGSSQMSDARVRMEQENLAKAQSPTQMKAAIENIYKVIGARKEAFKAPPYGNNQNRQQSGAVQSQSQNAPKLSPQAQKVGSKY